MFYGILILPCITLSVVECKYEADIKTYKGKISTFFALFYLCPIYTHGFKVKASLSKLLIVINRL